MIKMRTQTRIELLRTCVGSRLRVRTLASEDEKTDEGDDGNAGAPGQTRHEGNPFLRVQGWELEASSDSKGSADDQNW